MSIESSDIIIETPVKKTRAIWRRTPPNNFNEQISDQVVAPKNLNGPINDQTATPNETTKDSRVKLNKVTSIRQQFEACSGPEKTSEKKEDDYSRFLGWTKSGGAYERRPKFRSRAQTGDSQSNLENHRHSMGSALSQNFQQDRDYEEKKVGSTKLWRSVSTRQLPNGSDNTNQTNDRLQRLLEMRTRLRKSRENLANTNLEDEEQNLDPKNEEPVVVLRQKHFTKPPEQLRRRSCIFGDPNANSSPNLSLGLINSRRGIVSVLMNTPNLMSPSHPEEPNPPCVDRPVSWAPVSNVSIINSSSNSSSQPKKENEDVFASMNNICLKSVEEFQLALDKMIQTQQIIENASDLTKDESEQLVSTLTKVMQESSDKLIAATNRRHVSFLSTTLTSQNKNN